jgi:hypothetical protein
MAIGDILMSKPNFQMMDLKELKAYYLAHRDDRDAFYAYVDKLHSEGNWIEVSASQSLDELENYPEFMEKLRQDPGRRI